MISRLVALALLLTPALFAVEQPPPRAAQPLDPLTAAERRQAEEVARADARVKELLGGGRSRLVYVDFIAIKPPNASTEPDSPEKPLAIGRHAEVVFYRYDDDSGVRALVDLQQRSVAQAARIDSAEVPLNTEELSESMALALKNDAVTSLLGADANTFQA